MCASCQLPAASAVCPPKNTNKNISNIITTIHSHLPLPHNPETHPESSSSISSTIYSCHATQQPHSCPSTIAPTASRSYPLRYHPPSQELGGFAASALCLSPNDICLCRCLSIFPSCSAASAALLITGNHHPGRRSGTRSSCCASALCSSSLRCNVAGLRWLAQKLRTSLPPLALACRDQTSDDDDDATQLCTLSAASEPQLRFRTDAPPRLRARRAKDLPL